MLIEIKNDYYNVLSIDIIEKPHAYFCVFKESNKFYEKTLTIEDAENMSIVVDGKYAIVNENFKINLDEYCYEIIYCIKITLKNKNSIAQNFSTLEEAVLYRNDLVNKINKMVFDAERFNKLNKMLKELFLYE